MNEYVSAGFRYVVEVVNKHTGVVRDREEVKNLMPEEGIRHTLNGLLKNAAPVSTWYIGLFKGNYTPQSTDVMATFPVDATEATEYADERHAFVPGTIVGTTVDNAASRAEFTFSAPAVVHGGFISSSAAKGSTSGVLLSVVRFGSPKSLGADEILRVTAGFIMASA